MKNRSVLLGMVFAVIAYAAHGDVTIDNGDTLDLLLNANYGTNDLVMGVYTSGNGLRIHDGIGVGAGDAYFGDSSASSGNFVELGNNSLLSLQGSLFLGYAADGNSIDVGAGAEVYSALDGIIGNTAAAENNSVLVSGSNSYWRTDGNLFVGYGGSNNRMELLDGADSYVGQSLWIGVADTATNNSVTLSNSTMAVGGDVVVGFDGSGNRLELLDGSKLWSYGGTIGETTNADDNSVVISGDGSVWTLAGGLQIGNATNSGNSLLITNSGIAVVHGNLVIEGSNELNLEKDAELFVLSDFDGSMSGFNFNAGGSLYVGGALTGMSGSIEGGRTVGLLGTNGEWNLSGSNLVVGGASSGNWLVVEQGARVSAGALYLGAGAAVTGNTVTVTGDGSVLDVAGSMVVGATSNANNEVEVVSGGTILLGGDLIMGGSSNTFSLGDGGWLVAGNGFDASVPGFDFLAGGTLESMGSLTGLTGSLEDRRAVLLTGSNAVWNLGTNALSLGITTSSNELYVSDGARMVTTDALIGSAATTNSFVYVSGAGAVWENSGDLTLDGYYNDLIIGDGANVSAGQSLAVKNEAALIFETGGSASASNYYQDASSIFAFESVTNSPASPALLTVSDTAEFEGGATVEYTGTIKGLERGVIFTNKLVAAGTLVVNGVTNATGSALDALNIAGIGSLLSIHLFSENDDLYALITRMRLAESAGFADGTDMADVSDEIDQLTDDGNTLAKNMLDTLSQLDSSGQHAQLSQLYDRHAPTYAHVNGMLEGFRQVRMRGVVPDPMLPQGAYGPHFYGRQTQGWIKGYGSWGNRDAAGSFSGYDQSTYGALLGFDKSYGDILAGIAGGTVSTEISQDDGDKSTADTKFGLVYASLGTLSWYGDINLGYGQSSIADHSGSLFDTTAAYDADQLAFYMGGGKEMVSMNDHLFITPSAALSGSYYLQDSYTEKSSTALPRQVDSFDYFSLKSELGIKTSYTHDLRQSVLVPEIHANWLHEFNDSADRIGYSIVGGTGRYSFGMDAPIADLYEVGTGLSWWMHSKTKATYEWFVGLDGRFGDGYTEATASLRLLGQF